MINYLGVPEHFCRNSPEVAAAGFEYTGELLIKLATNSMGLESLVNVDVLDVGCGVRFTSAIINRKIPVKSYTGIEVFRPIVDFLKSNVEIHDKRFKFSHWDVQNEMYNPDSTDKLLLGNFPVEGMFDVIWMFSVITHMNPNDSLALFKLLRGKVRAGGQLFFSAFIDEGLDGFDDRVKDQPLLNAYYGREYIENLLGQAGWKVNLFHDKDPDNFIQHYLVCSPC